MSDLDKLVAKIGGTPEDLARVRSLRVELVASTATSAHAVVRDGARLFPVFVRRSFSGRCECEGAGQSDFCDHIAAAALTWLIAAGAAPTP